MRIDAVELHVGPPDFPYTRVRELEAKSESRTVFSGSPSHDSVNAQLRAMAAKLGADVVINIEYKSGVSMSSWNSLKATGTAVKRSTVPAETSPIPDTASDAAPVRRATKAVQRGRVRPAGALDPVRSTDNPSLGPWLVLIVALALIAVWFLS